MDVHGEVNDACEWPTAALVRLPIPLSGPRYIENATGSLKKVKALTRSYALDGLHLEAFALWTHLEAQSARPRRFTFGVGVELDAAEFGTVDFFATRLHAVRLILRIKRKTPCHEFSDGFVFALYETVAELFARQRNAGVFHEERE